MEHENTPSPSSPPVKGGELLETLSPCGRARVRGIFWSMTADYKKKDCFCPDFSGQKQSSYSLRTSVIIFSFS